MKKLLILIATVLFSSCCVSEKEKNEFRDYFFFRISIIVDYNELVESGNEIHLNDWMVFLENCSYLETLSGYKFNFNDSDPPYYESIDQLVADTTNLSKWYNQNEGKWTMQKADKYVYKKRKGHTIFF